jgi:hypothetical protein
VNDLDLQPHSSHELLYSTLPTTARIVQRYSAELRTEWPGVRVLVRAGNFSPHHLIQTGSGAHPASYPMGTRSSSLGVKRPGHWGDHSPPSSAEVKNAWRYTSTPPIRLQSGQRREKRRMTGRLERELKMVQLSATRYSCIAILWVSIVSFAAITLCVASQQVFIVASVHFVINSVRKLLDTPLYIHGTYEVRTQDPSALRGYWDQSRETIKEFFFSKLYTTQKTLKCLVLVDAGTPSSFKPLSS